MATYCKLTSSELNTKRNSHKSDNNSMINIVKNIFSSYISNYNPCNFNFFSRMFRNSKVSRGKLIAANRIINYLNSIDLNEDNYKLCLDIQKFIANEYKVSKELREVKKISYLATPLSPLGYSGGKLTYKQTEKGITAEGKFERALKLTYQYLEDVLNSSENDLYSCNIKLTN